MISENDDEFTFETSLWKRSQNSYATTIPKEVLAIKNAPTGDDAVVQWRINPETGEFEVSFTTKGGDNE